MNNLIELAIFDGQQEKVQRRSKKRCPVVEKFIRNNDAKLPANKLRSLLRLVCHLSVAMLILLGLAVALDMATLQINPQNTLLISSAQSLNLTLFSLTGGMFCWLMYRIKQLMNLLHTAALS
ncbi:MAG: hypothetical protein HRU25_15960 [Psychrobium sp.]|nr:hypothetical protein [Psychrobium sp.]